ncbi:type VII secretion integral membrane protein EccD [Streptomyces sp. HNM0663]|uniref:Type VII secretion integral membrane protein EccD n=1 Tax=Streptomyces chengmaiensis TaxID=3040919 RepID=A0ABT6HYZ8_9ACTN|nr:type VII secretion integral membrane protein EccD [Streptomyces chengmaiensis]MDH2393571.1 type VII secretion integral membrane protein EccD [Streptomyces chengmaiensis]
MDDELCRITVVGARRRVDLAVPARAAIAEYAPSLVRLTGQEQKDETFPAVWSLALPGARPLSPGASLTESGVADGATLYLRDVAAGEFDEPLITDLDELVGEANEEGLRWDTRHRALTLLFLGLGGTAGALGWFVGLAVDGPRFPLVGPAALLAGFGVALLAWHATRRAWPLALPTRLGVALSAVPLLAVGTVLLPTAMDTTPRTVIAASAGALAGALAARLAVNHVVTLTALVVTAVLLPTAGLLSGFGASSAESAAVVAVLAMGSLSVAPTVSGRLVALSAPPEEDAATGEAIPALVRRGRRVLAGLTQLLSAVLIAALTLLATSDDAYGLVLAVSVSGVLLLRAGQLKITAAVLPVVVAGTTGLLAVAISTPGKLGAPDWAGPLAGLLAGPVMLAAGLIRAFPEGESIGERPAWISGLSSTLALAAVPLAVGVFGVFGKLMEMGGGI